MKILRDEARWDVADTEKFNYIMQPKGLYTLTDQNHRATRLTLDELQAVLRGTTPAYKFKVSNPKTIKRSDRHWLTQPFQVSHSYDPKSTCSHIKYVNSKTGNNDELFFPHDFLIGFLSGTSKYCHLKNSFEHFGFKTTDRSENYPHVILSILLPHLIWGTI